MATPNHSQSWSGPSTLPPQQQQQQQQYQLQPQQQQQPQLQQQHQPQMQQGPPDDMGLQTRPMGLKVHYTFDREGQVNCLARWPHILQVQTVPIDERNTIGVIDLRTCLQAIAQCSPEIVNQQDNDYTVYAYDYSEPDMPLVGQGMLSWGLEYSNDQTQQQQQLVTGRVTRNLLAILSNGSRETLEVKMKLTAVAKIQRSGFSSMDGFNMPKSAPTPTDTTSTEWNSFLQSNPMLGHSGNVASIPSPALPPAHLNTSINETRPVEMRNDYPQHQPIRPASIPPPPAAPIPSASIPPVAINPRPAGPPPSTDNTTSQQASSTEVSVDKQARPSSRPSSRASRRSRVPTGRPRGRPRKNPLETGNTSAAEEATTDGDDGPQKKRVKITKGEYSAIAPFGSAPDSLRVAASTSGSLRNMRPVGSGGAGATGNHGQDVPRAPTPVPDMSRLSKHHRSFEKSKSESMMDSEAGAPYQSRFSQPALSMDGQSPAESTAQSPDPGYTPEDSPGDIGSSPPVPRASAYMRISPMASSPILPPMPLPQVDSGFMSGGIDDFFDDDELLQDLPHEQGQDLPQRRDSQAAQAAPPVINKPNSRKTGRAAQKQPAKRRPNFPFQEVNPGPPELLPTKSIFNPAGRTKTLNRAAAAEAAAAAAAAALPPQEQPANRVLKRATTDPTPLFSEQEQSLHDQFSQGRSTSHQPVLEPIHDVADIQMSEAPSQIPHFDEPSQGFSLPPSQSQNIENGAGNGVSEAPQEDVFQPTIEAHDPLPVPERPVPEPVLTLPTKPTSRPVSRSASSGPLTTAPTDVAPEPVLSFPQPFMSEAPCPPSDAAEPRYNKNLVKKQSIKERLETAIQKGEMPPFCNNCGAIETPTWRKIWTQEHSGVPAFHEFSDKPGFVTMVDILQRDAEGKPSLHQLVKKNLGPKDDKKLWKETLLCNPCGIWLAKFKSHRPPDRWDKDAARLNQPRKKRERNRSKKSRTKSDAMNPTSEAYFTTDPLGPMDRESPKLEGFENGMVSRHQSVAAVDDGNDKILNNEFLNSNGSPKQSRPGSTHSRGSGTAGSPIAVEDDLGPTRRLLFPSPRKDGVPKVLGELAVNIVQTTTIIQEAKSAGTGKENVTFGHPAAPVRPTTPIIEDHDELEQELFGTPPCPSTPPPKAGPGPFKTPTRATPSHRPVTRSISRSIAKSPGQVLLQLQAQRTPSKTPRSTRSNNMGGLLFGLGNGGGSATKRRSPRHAHFALDDDFIQTAARYGGDCSPFTASLNQLLSEANDFTQGSPSHGLVDFTLPTIDSDDGHVAGGLLDFGNFLSTDLVMPSSPPLMRNHAAAAASMSLGPTADSLWAQMTSGSGGGGGNGLEKEEQR